MTVITLRNCAVCACEPEPFPNCPGCGGSGGFTQADVSTKDGVTILSVIPSTPYTPGPWSVNPQPDPTNPRYATIYVKPGNHETVDHVAQVGEHLTKHSGDWQANARLIAAAPEMLEALKFAEEDTPPDDEPRKGLGASVYMSWECIDFMRAAIAKAEGR